MATTPPTYDDILRLFQETDRQLKQTDRQLKETDLFLKETALLLREKSLETDRKFQATDRQLKETDRQIKELGKQIGGLGSKFGSFTEGLALPSMEAILQQRFGMTVVLPRVRAKQQGEHLEIDVLAYANGEVNRAFLVEVKSHPREEAITQLKITLSRFRDFFPEHRDKQLYGILATVDWPPALKAQAIGEGLYVARIHDDVFDLEVEQDFQPKAF
jgi:DNA-binding transcriptional MerR regulator